MPSQWVQSWAQPPSAAALCHGVALVLRGSQALAVSFSKGLLHGSRKGGENSPRQAVLQFRSNEQERTPHRQCSSFFIVPVEGDQVGRSSGVCGSRQQGERPDNGFSSFPSTP